MARSRPVIAIDGPAGSGKTTLARRMARALGLPHVDTGLMYRILTLEARRAGVDVDDAAGLERLTSSLRFGLTRGGDPPVLTVDGEVPGDEVRAQEVDASVSAVARHPRVRERMRRAQRALGADGGVLEGRDIGSVVFPDADLKIFLDADEAERAARRARERGLEHPEAADRVADALSRRDERDARVNPLVPASDAVHLDTTQLGPDEVLEHAMAAIRERWQPGWGAGAPEEPA